MEIELRDYLAAKALPLVATGHCDPHATVVWVRSEHFGPLAVDAYAFADAMLEERAKAVNLHDEILTALKAMVASYDGLRDVLTCPRVKAKLAAADAAIAKAEAKS